MKNKKVYYTLTLFGQFLPPPPTAQVPFFVKKCDIFSEGPFHKISKAFLNFYELSPYKQLFDNFTKEVSKLGKEGGTACAVVNGMG
jgi:hypothetical protein